MVEESGGDGGDGEIGGSGYGYHFGKNYKKIGESPISLTDKSKINKIHEQFPIPKEHKILWADVEIKNKIYGLVLTDKGIFLKASNDAVKEYNLSKEKKDKIKNIYHYIRWEFFDTNDFVLDNDIDIRFNNVIILKSYKSNRFFRTYRTTNSEFIKESTVSSANIFADLESVIPANFAAVNTTTGHGEMAEEALTLLDKLDKNIKKAEVVGRTNEKNGADRLVDGIKIQTKYYATGNGCIKACFDSKTGEFRYFNNDGSPMLIEVPKDKYAEAINAFRNKILEGKVKGVTNPDDASKYIKQGKLTYNQAKNLCKPLTIESLTYDAATGAINCTFALGITFLSTFIICYTQTGDRKQACTAAFLDGIQVFGLSFFFTHFSFASS